MIVACQKFSPENIIANDCDIVMSIFPKFFLKDKYLKNNFINADGVLIDLLLFFAVEAAFSFDLWTHIRFMLSSIKS